MFIEIILGVVLGINGCIVYIAVMNMKSSKVEADASTITNILGGL